MNYKFLAFTLFTMVLLFYGLHQGLYVAPQEQTMGEIQRIFYYHVPSAWTSFLCFFVNFIASIVYLARRKSSPAAGLAADAVAVASAEVGVVFCTVVLVTGPMWAKPVWGIWWTWDARLTTTLILWLIYLSYIQLRHYAVSGQAPTLAAVVAIIGFLDVPLVYMAIRWFRTQHPQPVIAGGPGSGLDPAMWTALLWNWAAFLAFGFLLIWMRYNLVRFQQQLDERYALAALQGQEVGVGAATPGGTAGAARTYIQAVASLILGAVSLVVPIIPGILAIVLGHVTLSSIKKSMGRLKGGQVAVIGLILGYFSMSIVAFRFGVSILSILGGSIVPSPHLAYAATWIIHIAYIIFLTVKFRRLKREFEELEKEARKK